MIMVRNVRAYISDRQEQMQRIVSYISFQRIPGKQPGIFCVAEAVGNIFPFQKSVSKKFQKSVE